LFHAALSFHVCCSELTSLLISLDRVTQPSSHLYFSLMSWRFLPSLSCFFFLSDDSIEQYSFTHLRPSSPLLFRIPAAQVTIMLYKPIYLAIALISLALFNQVAMCYFAHGNSTTTIYDAATTTATVFVDPLGSPVKQPTSTFASSATSTTTSTTTAHTKPQPFLAACRVKVLVFLNNFIAFGLVSYLLVVTKKNHGTLL